MRTERQQEHDVIRNDVTKANEIKNSQIGKFKCINMIQCFYQLNPLMIRYYEFFKFNSCHASGHCWNCCRSFFIYYCSFSAFEDMDTVFKFVGLKDGPSNALRCCVDASVEMLAYYYLIWNFSADGFINFYRIFKFMFSLKSYKDVSMR